LLSQDIGCRRTAARCGLSATTSLARGGGGGGGTDRRASRRSGWVDLRHRTVTSGRNPTLDHPELAEAEGLEPPRDLSAPSRFRDGTLDQPGHLQGGRAGNDPARALARLGAVPGRCRRQPSACPSSSARGPSGPGRGSRTPTPSRAPVPETGASTRSARPGCRRGGPATPWCPWCESNGHFAGFGPAASASWATGRTKKRSNAELSEPTGLLIAKVQPSTCPGCSRAPRSATPRRRTTAATCPAGTAPLDVATGSARARTRSQRLKQPALQAEAAGNDAARDPWMPPSWTPRPIPGSQLAGSRPPGWRPGDESAGCGLHPWSGSGMAAPLAGRAGAAAGHTPSSSSPTPLQHPPDRPRRGTHPSTCARSRWPGAGTLLVHLPSRQVGGAVGSRQAVGSDVPEGYAWWQHAVASR
jgi:hypothetical protein